MLKKNHLARYFTISKIIFIILLLLNGLTIIAAAASLISIGLLILSVLSINVALVILLFVLMPKKTKSGYFNFLSSLPPSAQEKLRLAHDLKLALDHHELDIVYQPIIDLQSGNIIELEALMRWNHPKFGPISPGKFIPIAEEMDLIETLGQWILIEACHQSYRWKKAGFDLGICVNLSALQLKSAILDTIESALEETKLQPQHLTLEITETSLMKNSRRIKSLLKKIKLLGIKLALDDFGIGYSSLNYLKQFPFNKIKIDKSFIDNLGQEPNAEAILSAIITLSKKLGLSTIAEGVETREQIYLLHERSCEQIQGFFFSNPLSAKEMTAFLEKNPNLWQMVTRPVAQAPERG